MVFSLHLNISLQSPLPSPPHSLSIGITQLLVLSLFSFYIFFIDKIYFCSFKCSLYTSDTHYISLQPNFFISPVRSYFLPPWGLSTRCRTVSWWNQTKVGFQILSCRLSLPPFPILANDSTVLHETQTRNWDGILDIPLPRPHRSDSSPSHVHSSSTIKLESNLFCFVFFLINLFILFIYFWLRWVFIAARGLSLVTASGGYSSLRCSGFSLRWLLLSRSTGSRRAGFCSCGTWAYLLRGMWDLPGPGLEPLSPALAGGFLTTVPPGKSHVF